ncbi:hypothetical protein Tco_0058598 [Tanacetum coccineum]
MFSGNPHKNSQSTWAAKWFKRLVAYAKCNCDSFERCGARMLNKLQESIPNRSSRMLYRMLKLPVMVDVAQGSRLRAWLRACCLFILPSKSRGVFRSNSTLVLKFSFP